MITWLPIYNILYLNKNKLSIEILLLRQMSFTDLPVASMIKVLQNLCALQVLLPKLRLITQRPQAFSLLRLIHMGTQESSHNFYKLTPVKLGCEVRGIDLKQNVPPEGTAESICVLVWPVFISLSFTVLVPLFFLLPLFYSFSFFLIYVFPFLCVYYLKKH